MRRPRPLIPTPDIAPPPKGSRTFALDAQDAQRRLNNINDPEAIRDSIVSHGLYERAFFTWADVRAIAPEKVWGKGLAKTNALWSATAPSREPLLLTPSPSCNVPLLMVVPPV